MAKATFDHIVIPFWIKFLMNFFDEFQIVYVGMSDKDLASHQMSTRQEALKMIKGLINLGDTKTIDSLIKSGDDGWYFWWDGDDNSLFFAGTTSIIYAAERGQVEIMKLFIRTKQMDWNNFAWSLAGASRGLVEGNKSSDKYLQIINDLLIWQSVHYPTKTLVSST